MHHTVEEVFVVGKKSGNNAVCTCRMLSKLNVVPLQRVNSPLAVPVMHRLPSGVHKTTLIAHRTYGIPIRGLFEAQALAKQIILQGHLRSARCSSGLNTPGCDEYENSQENIYSVLIGKIAVHSSSFFRKDMHAPCSG